MKIFYLVGLKDAPFYSRFDSIESANEAASLMRRSNDPEIISVIETKSLEENLKEKRDDERFNMLEAKDAAGINSCGACAAQGAIVICNDLLKEIEEAEARRHNE